MKPPTPSNEVARLETLYQSGLLDSLPEQAYDDITLLASHICGTPIAIMSLIDSHRQWFKSIIGIEVSETPLEQSFCAHAILQPEDLFIVPDARLDPRFANNPLVIDDPTIRFYAGAPLVTSAGHALGALCVIDRTPRELTEMQKRALQALSRQVIAQVALGEQAEKMQSLNEQLQRLSIRDELTGVNNRRAFNIALKREMAHTERYGAPLSLVMLDVDKFKLFNDSFGHQAGDEVLRKVGAILPKYVEEMGVAARYGGEEFALILPDTNAETAIKVAESVRRAIECAIWPHRPITASLGIATTTSALNAEATLLAAADAALYASKNAGRNRVTHYRCLN
jgi:diguanylate cyclase (GGDEF)-like protein